jgi:hypothetical protein
MARLTLHREFPGRDAERPCPVTFVSGGTIFTEREFFLGLGGYREDFFMYEEDTELCQRVRRTGRDLVIVPGARVYDLGPPPTYNSHRVGPEKIRNHLALITLHAPAWMMPLLLAKYFLGTIRRLPMMTPDGRRDWVVGWRRYFAAVPLLLRDRLRLSRLGRAPAAVG